MLVQKLVACASYVVALVGFVGATTLLLSLLFERPGQLVVTSARESVVGIHEAGAGLVRYALAMPLLAISMGTVALLGFAMACFPVRAATATMLAVMLLIGDWIVNIHPALAVVSPYTLMTRIASWRQVFNQEIPWLRLERNYGELAALDVALIVIAWLAFRRRALTPR
jgi:ABC-2 type transport system permease protein